MGTMIPTAIRNRERLRSFEGMWVAEDEHGEIVASAPNAHDLETALDKMHRADDKSLSIRRIPRPRRGRLT